MSGANIRRTRTFLWYLVACFARVMRVFIGELETNLRAPLGAENSILDRFIREWDPSSTDNVSQLHFAVHCGSFLVSYL